MHRLATRVLLLITMTILINACSTPLTTKRPEESQAATVPSPTPTIIVPTNTARPFAVNESVEAPLPWPVAYPSNEQIEEARECNIPAILEERYPDSVKAPDLWATHYPSSACDWAVLAVAFSDRTPKSQTSHDGLVAMKMALYINQAYALKQHLIMAYFGQGQFVEPPPFVEIVAIREVEIIYHWIGLASSNIDYQITITNANTNPQAQGVINGETIFSSLDKERVQALGPALTDLFPIGSALKNLAPCTDNYPNWVVIVNFEDGTTLEMVTNDSNLVGVGGPWQTKIEGRLYFQASASFFITLADILEQLKLEIDDRTTWGCTTILPIFDLAYPSGTE